MLNKINSKQNEKIKEIVKLSSKSYQDEKGLFIIEGFHLLEMALASNLVHSIYTLKEIENIPTNIPQYIITPEIIKKISSTKSSQGVLAITKMKKEEPISSKKILYLDDINDPGNLGTIIRSALAFGYKDIIVSSNTCSIYNSKVVQSSQGAIFDVNVIKGDLNLIKSLKEKGYLFLVTALKDAVDISSISSLDKYIIALGNESHGVKPQTIELADKIIKIKIESMESLNVAIAGAIAMYTLNNK